MAVKFKEKIDSMSTVLDCKLGGDYSINPIEVERFNCSSLNCFFAIRQDKKNTLVYTAPLATNISKFLANPISKHNLFYIVEQVVNGLISLQEKEFMWNNVCWDINNIYIIEQTCQLKMVYLPINEGYDVCRAKDLIVSIICRANIFEDDDAFVSDFIRFINSQEYFNPLGIEEYISSIDSSAVEQARTPQVRAFNSDALSDGINVADDDEEETGLLVEESVVSNND